MEEERLFVLTCGAHRVEFEGDPSMPPEQFAERFLIPAFAALMAHMKSA